MSKTRYVVRCQECGYLSPKWMGKCPDCGQWNTMVEEPMEGKSSLAPRWKLPPQMPQKITVVPTVSQKRYPTQISELDRVLGGGIVPGSLILIGGEPGIGKSTLLLQVSSNIARSVGRVLLVSGEESTGQIRMRADRLGALSDDLFILAENDVEVVQSQIQELNPALVVIDSIQTMFCPDISSAPGSVSQVRESTSSLMRLAKRRGAPLFIAGHVTKEGSIAGPRVLEHIVDTVLYFEGDKHLSYRIIRSVKNRYGSTNEIGVFEMKAKGLEGVEDPSVMFLAQRSPEVPGSVVVATVEGTRPLCVELQALVTQSHLAIPRRFVSGLDYNRLSMVLAVLERRLGFRMDNWDVHVNVAGGVRVTEPAADLGMALALISAYKDSPLPGGLVAFGEIGLAGEARFVSQVEMRLREIAKLGFKKVVMPAYRQAGPAGVMGELPPIETLAIGTLKEALRVFETRGDS
ncbi:MAG: DNA repair protein RadA [Actinomycetota bacterium]|nr:DNA repair protein RadA [Actinomycetota bacterium]